MKTLIASILLLFATTCFSAVPAYTKFKGIGGILVTTNPPDGDVIIDGTGIGGTNTGLNAAQVTNIVNAVVNTNVSYTSNYFITYITTIFAYTSNYFNTGITYTSNYFNTLFTTIMNTVYEVGSNDTNYVNTASSNNVRVAAGANITVVTNGSAGVTIYTVSGAAGGSGGTNYPPVTRIGTNVAVGTGVRKSLTIQTNISFRLFFDGTPLNGENVIIGVSNTSTSVIYWTNTPGIFDSSVASNVTTFAVPALSVKWYEFVSSTNLNLGVARWELRSFLGKEVELAVASPGLAMHTNPANSIITISNTFVLPDGTLSASNVAINMAPQGNNLDLAGTAVFYNGSQPLVRFGGGNGFSFGNETHIDWYDGDPYTSTLDTILWRAGARSVGIKLAGSKAVPQPCRFYIANYYEIGGVNSEQFRIYFNGNILNFETYGTGDGESRPMQFSVGGSQVYMDSGHFMPDAITSIGLGRSDRRWTNVFSTFGSFESSDTAGFSVLKTGSGNPAFNVDTVNRRVGVGQAASPSFVLDVLYNDSTVYNPSNQNADAVRVFNQSTAAGAGAPIYLTVGGSSGASASIAAVRESGNNAAISFANQSAGGGLRETLHISSSGNIGIGTNQPQAKLDIYGNVNFNLTNDNLPLVIFNSSQNGFAFGKEAHIDWYDGAPISSTLDLALFRSGVGHFGLKRVGTKASPQPTALTIANYYEIGGVNQEYADIGWSSGVFTLQTVGNGDGVSEPMQFAADGGVVYLNGANLMPNTPLALGRTDGNHRWTDIFAGNGDFTGSVGIHTNAPASTLDLVGTMRTHGLPTNASPISLLGRLSTGEIVETATVSGGGNVSSNNAGGITAIGLSTNRNELYVEGELHGASLFSSGFVGDFALISDPTKQVVESSVTTTELATLSGIGSTPIITQLSNKVKVVAGANITVTPSGSGGVMTYTVAGSASAVAAPINSVQFNSNGTQQGSAKLVFTNGNLGVGGGRLPTANLSVYRGLAGTAMDLTGSADQTVNDLRVDFNLTNNVDAVGTYARLGIQAGDATAGEEYGHFYISTVNSGVLTEHMRITPDGALIQTNFGNSVAMINGSIAVTGIGSYIATNTAPSRKVAPANLHNIAIGSGWTNDMGARADLVIVLSQSDAATGDPGIMVTNVTDVSGITKLLTGGLVQTHQEPIYLLDVNPNDVGSIIDLSTGTGSAQSIKFAYWKLK